MKSFTIDGANFSDLGGFYDEVGQVICPGFSFGRNLDALNDAFFGGLSEEGVGADEPAVIDWLKSAKSEQDIGSEQFNQITEIIKNQGHRLILK